MKIIVFGATGDVGRKVVDAALARGHQITALGRSESKLATLPSKAQTICTDLLLAEHSIAGSVAGNDMIISALRPDEGQESLLVTLTEKVLQGSLATSVPVIVTGGAALLKLADGSGHTVLSAPDFLPDAVRPVAAACAKQDALLENSPEVAWTCLRPPAMLLPDQRSAEYAFGTDTLVTDAAGDSQISYTDFAAAMLDVAQNRHGFARRITVGWIDPAP